MGKKFEQYIYVYTIEEEGEEPFNVIATDLSEVPEGAAVARYRLGSIGEVNHKRSTFKVTKPQYMNR